MTKLICDICGTSYADTEEKCPTCGYSRAFEESSPDDERNPAAREKVRGGRYSKKNVRKRLMQRAEAEMGAEEQTASAETGTQMSAPEMAAEMSAAVAAMDAPKQANESTQMESAAEPSEELPEQDGEMDQPLEDPEAEEKKAVLAAYRRDVRLNLMLFFALVVFALSSGYMLINYAIPYLLPFLLNGF